MRRLSLEALRRRLGAERGFALPLALGASAVVMIAGTSVMSYSSANGNSTIRWSADQTAGNVAESGLSLAAGVLANPANNPFDPTLLPPRSTTLPTGTVVWSGTLDRANAVWTLTATSSVRNPTATNPVSRTVSERVRVTPVLTQPLLSDAWDYLFTTQAGVGGSCDVTVSSRATVTSPLYVSGNLCLASGASVAAGPLVVKNRLTLLATDSIVGSTSAPISAAHIGNSCKYSVSLWHAPCSAADNVYATVLDQVVPAVPPPTAEWDRWYRNAAPGPFQPCTAASGTPPVFENETAVASRNGSVPGSFSLTPPVSYTCRVGPEGAALGELSWVAAARTLTVNGTIFIDGSAKVDNGLVNTYQGQGTMYLSGTFLLTSGSKLCGRVAGAECDLPGWDPRLPGSPMLTVIANGNGGQVPLGDSIQLATSASFEGMLYGTNYIQLGASAQTKGGMVTPSILFGSSSKTYTFPALDNAPTGTPGAQVAYARVSPPQDFAG